MSARESLCPNCCVRYTVQTVKRDECKREFVSTPDALLKIISAILGPIWKEVTEEKQGGCVGQCKHVDVDPGRREAFLDAKALYNERIFANGVGCGSAA